MTEGMHCVYLEETPWLALGGRWSQLHYNVGLKISSNPLVVARIIHSPVILSVSQQKLGHLVVTWVWLGRLSQDDMASAREASTRPVPRSKANHSPSPSSQRHVPLPMAIWNATVSMWPFSVLVGSRIRKHTHQVRHVVGRRTHLRR